MIARHKLRPDYATPVALGHANIFNKMFGCCHKSQRCCNKTLRCCHAYSCFATKPSGVAASPKGVATESLFFLRVFSVFVKWFRIIYPKITL